MKYQKYILGALMLGSMASTFVGCSDDFLKEELINAQSTDYFKTQDGMNDLITGTYSALKYKFNYSDWSYLMWPMGTDEFTDAANMSQDYNGYQLNASNAKIGNLWDNMFNRIESANVAIKYVDEAFAEAIKTDPTQEATRDIRKGEAYFLRAFCYFQLVQQYGGVPLKLEATDGNITTEFTRASAKDCYAQIISDFETAYQYLPKTVTETGRLTKDAAAHFIAKAKLYRQSEINADWNSEYKASDLRDIIDKSNEVLANHALCPDFLDLWNYTKANDVNESVSEVVLAAQFSDDISTHGRYGNQMHLAYPAVYQLLKGCSRDISGGREFCYLRTTNYTYDVFDRVNDSRFWKSFITTYNCNTPKAAPTWAEGDAMPAGATVGAARFAANEIAVKYIINDVGDTEYEDVGTEGEVKRNGVLQAPHTFVRYFKGDAENWYSNDAAKTHGNYGNFNSNSHFVAMSKFRDGYRTSYNDQFGTRDGIIARSAEDVLFAAEAEARLGKYDSVVFYVNKLRARAAYKAGEIRSEHHDGGQAYKNNSYCTQFGAGNGGRSGCTGAIFCETNTYFESNKLEGKEDSVNLASSEANLLLTSYQDILNSKIDNKIYDEIKGKAGDNFGQDETFAKIMNFLLNERTRELCGEMQRWIDLSRCKALKGRWESFNDGCGREGKTQFEDYMNLRPIPQTAYIDAITNSDASSQQNPGY